MEAAGVGINWMAVVVAAVSSFVLGGLWYSPVLFAGSWMRATGLSAEDLARGNPAMIYGVSFVLALLASAWLVIWASPIGV